MGAIPYRLVNDDTDGPGKVAGGDPLRIHGEHCFGGPEEAAYRLPAVPKVATAAGRDPGPGGGGAGRSRLPGPGTCRG